MSSTLLQKSGHELLVDHLQSVSVVYREVFHVAEGRTDLVSQVRGNRLTQAAKAIIVSVKISKKDRKYVNAVVPGDRQIDFNAIARLFGATEARMAQPEVAFEHTACEMGTVTPFSFHPDLVLIVDPALLEEQEIVFNAGKLDLSFFLNRDDFVTAACPRVARIAK